MSQKIDKRPFPNTVEKYFLQDKNCNDRIYAYLLLQSKFNPNGRETHRYVEKMSNLQIAADLKLNKNTVGTRMKDLKSRGYVVQEGKYYLVPKPDYYTLIPKDTLDFLLYYLGDKDKIIKLYIVMWDYWVRQQNFTMLDLHRELGYALKDNKPQTRNSTHIRELLTLLRGASLIDYEIVSGRNEKGAPIDLYKIKWVRSNLPDMFKESYKRLMETGEITPEWEEIITSKTA